jgi:hypothetical protein
VIQVTRQAQAIAATATAEARHWEATLTAEALNREATATAQYKADVATVTQQAKDDRATATQESVDATAGAVHATMTRRAEKRETVLGYGRDYGIPLILLAVACAMICLTEDGRGYTFVDLDLMPSGVVTVRVLLDLAVKHRAILIGGTPGGGKTNLMQSIILQLAAKHTPTEVQFAIVDTKMVDFGANYERLPHLFAPIAHDMEEAARLIGEVENERMRRQTVMAAAGVADWQKYNATAPNRCSIPDPHRRREPRDPGQVGGRETEPPRPGVDVRRAAVGKGADPAGGRRDGWGFHHRSRGRGAPSSL